jgi:nucleoid DNA-binding protein
MSDEADPQAAGGKEKAPAVTRKELALRVQKVTGAKLRDVQLIVGATLEAMSQALKAGEALRLPPFGAAKVMRPADPETGTKMRVAVRQVKEKERAPKADRPPKGERSARAKAEGKAAGTRAGKAGKVGKAGKGGAKQALAAKDEAE